MALGPSNSPEVTGKLTENDSAIVFIKYIWFNSLGGALWK